MSKLPLVIVPVFNAYEHLRRCLESLERTLPARSHILLIDDASTNVRVQPLLQSWSASLGSNCRLITHRENRGFVATANHGMRLAETDVVLLNTDTEVTSGWLDRIADCLKSDRSIATVTPWSNNGEIVSIPGFCCPNPRPANPDAIAEAIALCGSPVYPEIPTAVGFCMAISLAAIRLLDPFDEETFGRGYGEENDFCQRAEQAGLRNVLCDDAYVVHHGGASFAPLGLKPNAESMQRLLTKHPEYQEKITNFIAADPLAPRRNEILACLERAGVGMG